MTTTVQMANVCQVMPGKLESKTYMTSDLPVNTNSAWSHWKAWRSVCGLMV